MADDDERVRDLALELGRMAVLAGAKLDALTGLGEDVTRLRESVETLARAIDLSVPRSELESGYPTYDELDERITRAERTARAARDRLASVGRRTLVVAALTVLAAVYLAVNVHDEHTERCGPASRPETPAEARWCSLTFPFHEHPTQAEADERLAERLLTSVGVEFERDEDGRIRIVGTGGAISPTEVPDDE